MHPVTLLQSIRNALTLAEMPAMNALFGDETKQKNAKKKENTQTKITIERIQQCTIVPLLLCSLFYFGQNAFRARSTAKRFQFLFVYFVCFSENIQRKMTRRSLHVQCFYVLNNN